MWHMAVAWGVSVPVGWAHNTAHPGLQERHNRKECRSCGYIEVAITATESSTLSMQSNERVETQPMILDRFGETGYTWPAGSKPDALPVAA